MKKQIALITYITIASHSFISCDQDVNRYYGRMGQDSDRYYGVYERDTPSHPTNCHCNQTTSQDSWDDVEKIPVIITSSTDRKRKSRKKTKQHQTTMKKIRDNS